MGHETAKEKVMKYRHRLEDGITEFMESNISERSANAILAMIECWERVLCMEKMMCGKTEFTHGDAEKWAKKMKNADGTSGAHWTLDQTSAVAKGAGIVFGHVTAEDFWVTMNMMYSDCSSVADKFNVSKPEFYAEMTKAFLFDKDGPDPKEKLAAYYDGIVCAE